MGAVFHGLGLVIRLLRDVVRDVTLIGVWSDAVNRRMYLQCPECLHDSGMLGK